MIYICPTSPKKRAGRIEHIFRYKTTDNSGNRAEKTYLYIHPLIELSPSDEAHDRYRKYSWVGGRLCCDAYAEGVVIMENHIVSHFAWTPMTLPSAQQCVHVMSLDKVFMPRGWSVCTVSDRLHRAHVSFRMIWRRKLIVRRNWTH